MTETLSLVDRIEKFKHDLKELRPLTPLTTLRLQFRDLMRVSESTDKQKFSTTLGDDAVTTYIGLVEFISIYEAIVSVAGTDGKKFFLGHFTEEADDINEGIDMDDHYFSLSTDEPHAATINEDWFAPDGTVDETIAGPTGVFAIEVLRRVHRQEMKQEFS